MPTSPRDTPGLPPLALYVHVPWCVRKCPYCDFNSHGVGRGAALPDEFVPYHEWVDGLPQNEVPPQPSD